MAKKTTKRPPGITWSEIAKEESAFVSAATKAVESVPAPADMVDRALDFAAKTLKSQREALVPLLDGAAPRVRKGAKPRPSAAAAVSAAYDLAERVIETQRKLLHGLIEAVTPPLGGHAPKSATTRVAPARRAPRKRVTHRTVKRAA
jgi:hypothetical protein